MNTPASTPEPRATKPRRKPGLVVTASCLALALIAWAGYRPSTPQWVELGSSRFATVAIEQALYRKRGAKHFFVHFRVSNLLSRPIAIRLSQNGLDGSPHPFWWQVLQSTKPDFTNQLRPIQLLSVSDDSFYDAKLLADFRTGKAVIIPANGSLDYYAGSLQVTQSDIHVPFWRRSKSFLSRGSDQWHVVLCIRGAIPFTDGKSFNRYSQTFQSVAIPYPPPYKQIPPKARILTYP